jgi:hypothetical protein
MQSPRHPLPLILNFANWLLALGALWFVAAELVPEAREVFRVWEEGKIPLPTFVGPALATYRTVRYACLGLALLGLGGVFAALVWGWKKPRLHGIVRGVLAYGATAAWVLALYFAVAAFVGKMVAADEARGEAQFYRNALEDQGINAALDPETRRRLGIRARLVDDVSRLKPADRDRRIRRLLYLLGHTQDAGIQRRFLATLALFPEALGPTDPRGGEPDKFLRAARENGAPPELNPTATLAWIREQAWEPLPLYTAEYEPK